MIFDFDYRVFFGSGYLDPLADRRWIARQVSEIPDKTDRFGVRLRMRLENLLEKQKAAILKNWFDLVVQTYPDDTSTFLKTQKDPFANPVGGTFKRGMEAILDELIKGWSHEPLISFLDPMIRIRAVQDFTPAQAVSFVFSLKEVIRKVLEKEANDSRMLSELHHFELQIDEIGLLAFNIYVECKEKIFQLKANEVKNRTFAAFERAGLVSELPGPVPGTE